jgi:hypothetical protein
MRKYLCPFSISAILLGAPQDPAALDKKAEPVLAPAPQPAAASKVEQAPQAAPVTSAPLVPSVYVLAPTAKEGMALATLDAQGREVRIITHATDKDEEAAKAGLPNAIGAFAPTPDGEAVFFLNYRVLYMPQVGVANVVAASIPGLGVLGAAIAGGIAGGVEASMTDPNARTNAQFTLTDISLWERSTGKVERLWDSKSLDTAKNEWPTLKDRQLMSDQKLSVALGERALATHVFPMKDRNFLVACPNMVFLVDAKNHKVSPFGITVHQEFSKGDLAWQDMEGHLRFVQPDRIICVQPDTSVTYVKRFWMKPVRFLNANDVLSVEGSKIQRFKIQGLEYDQVGGFNLKHDKLIVGKDGQHLFAYSHSSFGQDRLSKVTLDGKVLWTTKLGSCKDGIVLGEAEGKVWAAIPASDVNGAQFRYSLDASTGAILDTKLTIPANTPSAKEVPIVNALHVADSSAVISSRRLVWFPAAKQAESENGSWIAPKELGKPKDETMGMWAWVNPDLSMEVVALRSRASRMVALHGDQPIHFDPTLAMRYATSLEPKVPSGPAAAVPAPSPAASPAVAPPPVAAPTETPKAQPVTPGSGTTSEAR